MKREDRMPRKRLGTALAALTIGLITTAGARQTAKVSHTTLKTGDMAPDFTLLDNHWKQVHLSDYRGKKNVVLAFYVLAFTEG
jgi:cytochrome oxidase Cu insertion factor (SCO1/SenC/PrrC family)